MASKSRRTKDVRSIAFSEPKFVDQAKGDVSIAAHTVNVDEVAGRDINKYYFGGHSVQQIVDAFKKERLIGNHDRLRSSDEQIIKLAQQLNPDGSLTISEAIDELGRMVRLWLKATSRNSDVAHQDVFVQSVLLESEKQIKEVELDAAAGSIERGLNEVALRERENQSSKIALLEKSIEVNSLRRNKGLVAQQIELVVAAEEQSARPPWLPRFKKRYDDLLAVPDSDIFSLSVAGELARRMLATANSRNERQAAKFYLAYPLSLLGLRGMETELLEAIRIYQSILVDSESSLSPTRWANIQRALGILHQQASYQLADREDHLDAAVAAFKAAREKKTHGEMPPDWETEEDFADALCLLAKHKTGREAKELLRDAIAEYRAAEELRSEDHGFKHRLNLKIKIAGALRDLADREGTAARYRETVAAWTECLAMPATAFGNSGGDYHRYIQGRREEAEQRAKAMDGYLKQAKGIWNRLFSPSGSQGAQTLAADIVTVTKLQKLFENEKDLPIDSRVAPLRVEELKTAIRRLISSEIQSAKGFGRETLVKLYLDLSRFIDGWSDLDTRTIHFFRPGLTVEEHLERMVNSWSMQTAWKVIAARRDTLKDELKTFSIDPQVDSD
jgi:hypothetical protein